MSEVRTQSAAQADLRMVIEELWIDQPEHADLKRCMLAKFDALVRGQRHAYNEHVKWRSRNAWCIVIIALVATLVPLWAMFGSIWKQTLPNGLEPEFITGGLGIVSSALVAMYQGIGPRSKVVGFNEMQNRYKGLRDRLALKVRDRESFEALIAENEALRLKWNEAVPAAAVSLPK